MAPEVDPQDAPASSTFGALAWSDADDVPDVAPTDPYDYGGEANGGVTDARPQMQFDHEQQYEHEAAPLPWYRKPAIILGAGVLAVLAALAAAVLFVMRDDSTPTPASTTAPVTTTATPTTTAAAPIPAEAPAPPPQTQAPQTRTVTRQAPPPPVTITEAPTADVGGAAATASHHGGAAAADVRGAADARSRRRGVPTAPYPTIPGLPWVPLPGGQPAQPAP